MVVDFNGSLFSSFLVVLFLFGMRDGDNGEAEARWCSAAHRWEAPKITADGEDDEGGVGGGAVAR